MSGMKDASWFARPRNKRTSNWFLGIGNFSRAPFGSSTVFLVQGNLSTTHH